MNFEYEVNLNEDGSGKVSIYMFSTTLVIPIPAFGDEAKVCLIEYKKIWDDITYGCVLQLSTDMDELFYIWELTRKEDHGMLMGWIDANTFSQNEQKVILGIERWPNLRPKITLIY